MTPIKEIQIDFNSYKTHSDHPLFITMRVMTELFRNYVFYKAHVKDDKPTLNMEMRKVAWKDRTYEAAAAAGSSLWSALKSSAITGGIVGFAGMAAAGGTIFMNDQFNQIMPDKMTAFSEGLACSFVPKIAADVLSHYDAWSIDCSYYSGNTALSLLKGSLALGALMGTYSIGSDILEAIQNRGAPINKPIFEEELTADVLDLVGATYNIQKSGGYFQNALLYGPSGTGKTMLAKWIAKNSNMNYVITSAGNLVKLIQSGQHTGELARLFETARKSRSPTILFIDEADSLCRDRSKVNAQLSALLGDFLKEIEEPSNKIMLILATNKMEEFDPAVLSRMDHKLYIGLPEASERAKILGEHLQQFFSKEEMSSLFSFQDLHKISLKTEGLSGRSLFKLANHLSGIKAVSKNITPDLRDAAIGRFLKREYEANAMRPTQTNPQAG